MKYSTIIDPEASKPVVTVNPPFALTCPDCGAAEHAATHDFVSILVFSCGRVESSSYKNFGEWNVICPCPAAAWAMLDTISLVLNKHEPGDELSQRLAQFIERNKNRGTSS